MLVQFVSSETGEVLMYADVARVLLQAMGKEATGRGGRGRRRQEEGNRGRPAPARLAADRHAGADGPQRPEGQYRVGSRRRFLSLAGCLSTAVEVETAGDAAHDAVQFALEFGEKPFA